MAQCLGAKSLAGKSFQVACEGWSEGSPHGTLGPGCVVGAQTSHVSPLLLFYPNMETNAQGWAGVSKPMKTAAPLPQGLEVCAGRAEEGHVTEACGRAGEPGAGLARLLPEASQVE